MPVLGLWQALIDPSLPTIVDGDLKSKHPSWKNRRSNPYNNSLLMAAVDDIVISKDILFDLEFFAVSVLSSDHDGYHISYFLLKERFRLRFVSVSIPPCPSVWQFLFKHSLPTNVQGNFKSKQV